MPAIVLRCRRGASMKEIGRRGARPRPRPRPRFAHNIGHAGVDGAEVNDQVEKKGVVQDSTSAGVRLEHERLEVYEIALQFHAISCALLPDRGHRTLRDQLERPSLGVVLNIAEGAGRRSSPDKRRFYEMARGSATESAAIVDVLRVRTLASPGHCAEARALVVRIVQMLSRLVGPPR